MKNNIINETLVCELTDTQRREYGIVLATTLGDMSAVETEKKQNADHFKDRLAGMQAKADELSRKVRDGKEWRDVECVVYLGSPDREHKQIVRIDTGETVRTVRMTAQELQFQLPLEGDDDQIETPEETPPPPGELEVLCSSGDDDHDGPVMEDDFGKVAEDAPEPEAKPTRRGPKPKNHPEGANDDF